MDNGAICGGNHSTIKTKKEWKEHINKTMDMGCLDCLCGIGFTDRKGRYWSL